jgi:chromosome segregation ATPase
MDAAPVAEAEDLLRERVEGLEDDCESLEHELAEQGFALEEAQEKIEDLEEALADFRSRELICPKVVARRLTDYLEWITSPNTLDPHVAASVAETLLSEVQRALSGKCGENTRGQLTLSDGLHKRLARIEEERGNV